jgi:hypothetical protein
MQMAQECDPRGPTNCSGNTIVGTGSILVGGHVRKCRFYVLATADAGGGAAKCAAPLFSRGMKR